MKKIFQNKEKGIAIVFALGVISLLLVIGLGFLTNAIIEKKTENSFNSLAVARMTAESSLNNALASIKEEYSSFSGNNYADVSHGTNVDGTIKDYENLKELIESVKINSKSVYTWPTDYTPTNENNITWIYLPPDYGENTPIFARFAYAIVQSQTPQTDYYLLGEKIDLSASVDSGLNVYNFNQAYNTSYYAVSEDYPQTEATSTDVNGIPVIGRPGRDISELFLSTLSFVDKTDTAQKLSVTNTDPAGLLKYGERWGSLSAMCDSFNTNETPIYNIDAYADSCIFDAVPIPEAFVYEDSYDIRTGSGLYHRFNLTRNDWEGMQVEDIIDLNNYLKPFSKTDNGNIEKCIPWIANWKSTGDFSSAEICKKQIAANIIDYNDSNSYASTDYPAVNTPSYVGLEKCPYINEVKLKFEGSVTESSSSIFINGNLEIQGDNNSLPGGHVNGNIQFSDQWRSNNTTNGQTLNYYNSIINLGSNNPNFLTAKAENKLTMPQPPEAPAMPIEPTDISITIPDDITEFSEIDLNYYTEAANTSNSYFSKDIQLYESGNDILVKYGRKQIIVPNNSIIYSTKSITISENNFNRKVTLVSKSNVTISGNGVSIEPADSGNGLQIYAGKSISITNSDCIIGGNINAGSNISITKNNCNISGYLSAGGSITFDGWSNGGNLTTGSVQCGSDFTINSINNTVNGNIKCDGSIYIQGSGGNTIEGSVQCSKNLSIEYGVSNNTFKGNTDINSNITVSSGQNSFKGLLLARDGYIKIQGSTNGKNSFEGNIKSGSYFTVNSQENNFYGSIYASGAININYASNVFYNSIQGGSSLSIGWSSSNNTIDGNIKCVNDITISGESNTIKGIIQSTGGAVIIQGNGNNNIDSVISKKDFTISWSQGNTINNIAWSNGNIIILNNSNASNLNSINTIKSANDVTVKNTGVKIDNILWADGDISIPWASTHTISNIYGLGSMSIAGSIVQDCSSVWIGNNITLENNTNLSTQSLNCNGSLYIINSSNTIASSDNTIYTAVVSIENIDLELVNMYDTEVTCNSEINIEGTYNWNLGESSTLVSFSTTANINSITSESKSYTVPAFATPLNISPQNTQAGDPGLSTSLTNLKINSLKVKLTDEGSNLLDYSYIEPSTSYTDSSSQTANNLNSSDNLFFTYPVYAKNNGNNGNSGGSENSQAIQTAKDAAETAVDAASTAKSAAEAAKAAKDTAVEKAAEGDIEAAEAAATEAAEAAATAAEATETATEAAATAAEAAEIATGQSATHSATEAATAAAEATEAAEAAQSDANTAAEAVEAANSEGNDRVLSSDGSTGVLFFDYQVPDPRQNLNTSDWNGAAISKSSSIGTIGSVNSNFDPDQNTSDSDPEPNVTEPWELSTAFIRNSAMLSPWELGFIHRGKAWQTVNLKKYNTTESYSGGGNNYEDGDANILDQMKMTSNTQTYGKININSGIEEVLKTLFAKIRIGSNIASDEGPGTLKTSNDSAAPYISDSEAEDFAKSLININGAGTDSTLQFYTRSEILKNSGLANRFTGFGNTDALKEEVIGKYINLSTALRQFPDEFHIVVVAQAIKDIGNTTINGIECQTGRYDAGGDLILATQKILATVRRNPVNDKFYITDLEFID